MPRAAVELAKEWRTDRSLRHLEALLVVADAKSTFLLSGNGDVIEPDDGITAIGSGGPYALAAARALAETHQARRQGNRAGSHAHRQRNLHLHQCQFHASKNYERQSQEKDMVIYLSGEPAQPSPSRFLRSTS